MALERLDEFDDTEITKPGRENFTVKELLDGDAYTSFGKMASAVVLLQKENAELKEIVNRQTRVLNQVIGILKRKELVQGGVVGIVLAIMEILRYVGVLK